MTSSVLVLAVALIPAAESRLSDPVLALFRFWSQASVYFPYANCCDAVRYRAGKSARLLVRTYSEDRFGMCFSSGGAAVLFSTGEAGQLTVLREETVREPVESGCEQSLNKVAQDYFGHRASILHRHAADVILPPLAAVFRNSPPPSDADIQRLRATLERFIRNVVSAKGEVTITVGRWVRERRSTYAVVQVKSKGSPVLKEVLIVDPSTTDAHEVVLGAVSSPPIQKAMERAILKYTLFTVTSVADGE